MTTRNHLLASAVLGLGLAGCGALPTADDAATKTNNGASTTTVAGGATTTVPAGGATTTVPAGTPTTVAGEVPVTTVPGTPPAELAGAADCGALLDMMAKAPFKLAGAGWQRLPEKHVYAEAQGACQKANAKFRLPTLDEAKALLPAFTAGGQNCNDLNWTTKDGGAQANIIHGENISIAQPKETDKLDVICTDAPPAGPGGGKDAEACKAANDGYKDLAKAIHDADAGTCATDEDCVAIESAISICGSAFYGVTAAGVSAEQSGKLSEFQQKSQAACELVAVACTDVYYPHTPNCNQTTKKCDLKI